MEAEAEAEYADEEAPVEEEHVECPDMPSSAKVDLLSDYVDVYRQAIESLDSQIETAQVDFEIISEEKRLREEQEAAAAAQKAKENEYEDMVFAVNEAKAEMDNLTADVNTLQAEHDACLADPEFNSEDTNNETEHNAHCEEIRLELVAA